MWTIEHIFPEGQNVPDEWVKIIADGDKVLANNYRETYVHTLGNLEKTPAHSCDFSRELASQLLINIFIIYMANPHKYINLTVCMERLRIMCFPLGFLFL